MKERTILSERKKRELVERYNAGEKMKELCAEYGVDLSTGYNWSRAAGGKTRVKTSRGSLKICWKCGAKASNPNALFCCMCGAKLKTEADLMIDDLHYIAELTQFLPQSTRDRVIETVNRTMNFIKVVEKERAKNGNGLC